MLPLLKRNSRKFLTDCKGQGTKEVSVFSLLVSALKRAYSSEKNKKVMRFRGSNGIPGIINFWVWTIRKAWASSSRRNILRPSTNNNARRNLSPKAYLTSNVVTLPSTSNNSSPRRRSHPPLLPFLNHLQGNSQAHESLTKTFLCLVRKSSTLRPFIIFKNISLSASSIQ